MPSKVGNEAVNIFLLHEAALSLSSECKRLRLSVTFKIHVHSLYPASGEKGV
jgi:hypothetical protein